VHAVIVLPTYNERDNIEPFLRAVREVSDVDVLVVDDNSPDGTADLVRELGSELGGIEVLQRETKAGLGSAYRAGFDKVLGTGGDCAYDVVVTMDADLSHDPVILPRMLALIDDGADTVIGSRYVRGGGTTDWPIRRQLLSKWGNGYTRRLLRLTPHDCTSGYRAYRASALAAIDPHDTSAEGYAFLTELVRRLTRHGYRIVETPIVFRDRTSGKSKMSGRIIAESMLLVTKWGLSDRLRLRRRPSRV
jgi:dolichol-phosphate mannosyltransferase